jgi:hypothetical protein
VAGIYEVSRRDRFRFHDRPTKFHAALFRHSKIDGGNTDTQRAQESLLLFYFFKIRTGAEDQCSAEH